MRGIGPSSYFAGAGGAEMLMAHERALSHPPVRQRRFLMEQLQIIPPSSPAEPLSPLLQKDRVAARGEDGGHEKKRAERLDKR